MRFLEIYGSCGLFKGIKVANYFSASRSSPVWFLIVLGPLRFYHLFVSGSGLFEFLSPRPLWDFTTFFLVGRDLCIFWYFRALLCALRTYHLFPRWCRPVRFLLIFAHSEAWEILTTFSPLVWKTLNSGICAPLRSFWDFTTFFAEKSLPLLFPRSF